MTQETMIREFDKDLQKYTGKPLKELLTDIDGRLKVSYTIEDGVTFYGAAGGSMMVNQIGWYLADATVAKVNASESKFYDIELVLAVNR